MSLRVGTVVVGGKPAFMTTMEVGASFGKKRLYEITHEHGMQADRSGVSYVNAIGVDMVTLHDDRPIAKIGPRLRAGPDNAASIGARATFYTGLFHDKKTRSGGLGVELGGGIPLEGSEPAFEASLVATGRWITD